jgi:hypothetical protein
MRILLFPNKQLKKRLALFGIKGTGGATPLLCKERLCPALILHPSMLPPLPSIQGAATMRCRVVEAVEEVEKSGGSGGSGWNGGSGTSGRSGSRWRRTEMSDLQIEIAAGGASPD